MDRCLCHLRKTRLVFIILITVSSTFNTSSVMLLCSRLAERKRWTNIPEGVVMTVPKFSIRLLVSFLRFKLRRIGQEPNPSTMIAMYFHFIPPSLFRANLSTIALPSVNKFLQYYYNGCLIFCHPSLFQAFKFKYHLFYPPL